MEKDIILSSRAAERMRKNIDSSGDNEVFFQGEYDFEREEVVDVRVVARGNRQMAPAITSSIQPGDCVIHNHPSGDLRPSAADIRIASRLGSRGVGFIIVDNSVEKAYTVVEPEAVGRREELPEEEIASFLQEESPLEGVLDNFSEREEQLQVLRRVIAAFNDNESVLIEAGTGIGKSFAYLLPALYWNDLNEEVVVISTNTINLQQQLMEKDLVKLRSALNFDFKASLVKGRNNYICMRKLKNVLSRGEEDDGDESDELYRIAEYIDQQHRQGEFSGSYSEFDFAVPSHVWQELRSESDLCLGGNCPHLQKCFFQQAREKVHRSDVLVVNHHLLLSDMILKEESAGILPEFDRLIIDEAHNLPQAAHNISGSEFFPPAALKLLNRLRSSRNSPLVRIRNLEVNLERSIKDEIISILDADIWPLSRRLEEALKDYSQDLKELMPAGEHSLRMTSENSDLVAERAWQNQGETALNLFQQIQHKMERIKDLLAEDGNMRAESEDTILREVAGFAERLNKLAAALRLNLNYELHEDDYVFWLERDRSLNGFQLRQQNARIEVDEFLQEVLYSRTASLIMTSATLAVRDDFSYFKKRLGLEASGHFKVSSPFDYASQVSIFAPEDIPGVSDDDFIDEISPDLARFLRSSPGGALLLFTSYKMLHETRESLKPYFRQEDRQLLVQGQASRRQVLSRLRSSGRAVLLGTSSFWEGIDVQGEALSSLVIMRLPFAVPTAPLVAARQERIEERGGNSFLEEALPGAVLRFKQGFGRLIRSGDDRGRVLILDRRLVSRRYGKYFIDSLPDGCKVRREWPSQKSD